MIVIYRYIGLHTRYTSLFTLIPVIIRFFWKRPDNEAVISYAKASWDKNQRSACAPTETSPVRHPASSGATGGESSQSPCRMREITDLQLAFEWDNSSPHDARFFRAQLQRWYNKPIKWVSMFRGPVCWGANGSQCQYEGTLWWTGRTEEGVLPTS